MEGLLPRSYHARYDAPRCYYWPEALLVVKRAFVSARDCSLKSCRTALFLSSMY